MKFNIRLTALLLSLIMVLGIFAACDTGSPEETTAAALQETDAPETTAEETQPEANTFNLVVNGEAQVKIIRPQDLSSTDAAVAAAVKLRNEIEDAVGVKISMADDFKKATEQYDDSTLEILVGATAHSQVAEAIKGLSYGDYTVKAVGNKIVVFGFTYDAISYAAKQLAKIVEEYAVETDGKYTVSIPVEALNVVDTHNGSKHLSVIPTFEGASFSGTYETNLDCDEIILEDVTLESYNAYIAKLEAAGYTRYTGSDFSGNIFTTLYNKELTLNVGYYKPYDECRIIMEPFSEETLIGLESDNNRPTVTTSQITMLGCEYQKSDGSFVGNGLSLLFRLSDGSFVIVDGGHSGSSATWASNLVNAIEEQAKDYAKGKDIRIAAWFVSHCHGDHNGMLNNQSSMFKKFTVERVIANFMTDSERTKSINAYSNNWSSTEGSGDDATRTAAANMGADFIACHVGQRFFFGDTVFEILYTVESYGPQLVNALNTSTILVRAVTTDASGKSSTTMVMGDVTGPAMAICNKMYGKDMRSQIVQVAHHGYTTWGNDSAMATAYKYMAPEIVLWPQGSQAFPSYKEKSYNKVLWDGTNKNFQELFVAGWNNTQHTVPLPYNGNPDSVISNIKQKP